MVRRLMERDGGDGGDGGGGGGGGVWREMRFESLKKHGRGYDTV